MDFRVKTLGRIQILFLEKHNKHVYSTKPLEVGSWQWNVQRTVNRDVPSRRTVESVGLRSLACWDCGFESHRGHEYLSVVEYYVLSGRGLCNELITCPEKSYRIWRVICDLETSWMRGPWPNEGALAQWGGPGPMRTVAPQTNKQIMGIYFWGSVAR
jgi:hypothetical protein